MFPLTPEVIEKIVEIFGQIFEQLSDVAQYGLEVLMLKIHFDGVFWLVLALIATLIYLFILYWIRISTRPDERDDRYAGYLFSTIFWILVTAGMFYAGLLRLIVPEYYVIQFLLNTVK